MGQSIQIADASFSKVLASLTLPDRTGLIAEYLFGTDFSTSSRNLANYAVPLLQVGTPTYGSNYARVRSGTGGFGFNTQITPLADCTIIDIRGASSNYMASTYMLCAGEVGMYHRSGNTIFKGGTYADLSHGAINNAYNPASDFTFTAGVTSDGSGFAKHYKGDVTTGVLSVGTAANARTGTSTGIAYLGTANCSSTVNNIDHSHAYLAIFNRVLTQAEVDAVYQTLKPFMARRGITI